MSMTLQQAETAIYQKIGQFPSALRQTIGSDISLIGSESEIMSAMLDGIQVRIDNQPLPSGQPYSPPTDKAWCKVTLQYADSLITGIADTVCIRDQGIINIQCFVPKNTGTLVMTQLCDAWRSFLQSFGVSHLEIYKVHAPQSMDDQDFYAKIIRAEFRVN